jgi:probable 2-oxoglutarate dehydrogenase E1 component DHKTD1
LTKQSAKSVRESYKAYLTEELAQSDSFKPKAQMLQKQWTGLVWPAGEDAVDNPETGVDAATLVNVGKASVDVPEGFVSKVIMFAENSCKQ